MADRSLWVGMSRTWTRWRTALALVKPEMGSPGMATRLPAVPDLEEPSPSAAWTMQQLREAFPWDQAPRYLVERFIGSVHREYLDHVIVFSATGL
jgi:hypothetical protein